ncbi:DUF881 domain-containing protein [Motilibacter deserti]|uniref:DUF881 domain-containing protein n=1 Tax=Motilibacter deserti TaxID=2714956 RepID=A0ABX0GTP7_9ACTN|nr:DUF881 domain-containing protein [Motilibacter deserti]
MTDGGKAAGRTPANGDATSAGSRPAEAESAEHERVEEAAAGEPVEGTAAEESAADEPVESIAAEKTALGNQAADELPGNQGADDEPAQDEPAKGEPAKGEPAKNGASAEPTADARPQPPSAPSAPGTSQETGPQPAPDVPAVPGAAGATPAGRLSALRPLLGTNRRQIAIAALLALVGFAGAVQARTTHDAGLTGLRQADLVRILDDVDERAARLRAEERELEESYEQLASGSGGSGAAIEDAQRRADVLGILAGTLPAQGPGIELRIPDPGGAVPASQLLDAVQELRDAGAEAMQLGDVRVVASTAFLDASDDSGPAVSVDGVRVEPPYQLRAIGDPDALESALGIPGGVLESLQAAGLRPDVARRSSLEIDALHAEKDAQYARPAADESGG